MSVKTYPQFPNFHEVQHPLVQHKLAYLRSIDTNKKDFKELVHEITLLLAYEATQNLPMMEKSVTTPLETFNAPVLKDDDVVILPVLRAGLGMVEGFLTIMPSARVAHIGLARNEETLVPESYYFKIPEHSKDKYYFICDPMLATGGSGSAALARLKQEGIQKIIYICLVAAPEGVKHISENHPDVPIYAACLDRQLNEKGYILPGLGDAGDRLFGTK